MRNLRKIVPLLLVMVLLLGLCLVKAGAADTHLTLDNAGAAVTGGTYDKTTGYIINLTAGSTKVIYTAGKDVRGTYDVYLEVSKQTMGYGTTPFSIKVSDGKEIIPIIEYSWCKTDKSDLYSKGVFLCLKDTALKSGDTITVAALPGFGFGTTSYQPYIGDILLYQAGGKVAVGYDGVIPAEQAKDASDPLSGLQLIWLGSSVAYGQMAQGYSVADYLEEAHKALKSYKYCVPGTTLVDESTTSYISRMKQIPTDIHPDYFIVQLSTNDAALNKSFGTLSSSKNIGDFDTKTIYGGLEYIIAYVQQTWKCPVVFFTGMYYDKSTYSNDGTAYGKTVQALLDVQKKWGIHVIDLYNDTALKAMYNNDQWKTYMSDGVHPKAEGYKKLWGPKFEQALTSYITADSAASTSPSPTPTAATQQAVSNFATVTLNGVAVSFDSYVINQETYFKLRDIAYKLNGTPKQFGVGWDGAKNAISLTSNTAYQADGTEMAGKGSGTKTATLSTASIYLDGKLTAFTAYTIGQNNYFRLRDLGQTFNFGVGWDDTTKTVKIDTSTGYTK